MKNYKYDIGLDIGTNSIGWAVVNNQTNQVVRKFNKTLWGALLFDEAETAESRRSFRSSRKRYDRRRKRIKLLRKEFQEEIKKVDSDFYQKLEEFFLHEEDKKVVEIEDNFFRTYQKLYPTIYHLRKELINTKEKKDIRLVYLALHHIIKYRGNFLYENETFNVENLDIEAKLEELLNLMEFMCPEVSVTRQETILEEIIAKSEDVEKNLKTYFKKAFNENEKDWTAAILGKKFNIYKLIHFETEEKKSISFKDDDYEALLENLEKELGEKIEILDLLKQIYNIIFLKRLLKSEKYISYVMVNKYEKHGEDLKLLKSVLKNAKKEDYRKILKGEDCSYQNYLRNKITEDEFITQLEKVVNSLELSEEKAILNQYLHEKDFLPKTSSKENGTIPYQVHDIELKQIIENQGKYYPFLLEKTKNNNYRIQELLKFRIPYYVGPLNNTTSEKNVKNSNAWAECYKKVPIITPFNFDEVIDKDKSASNFIERMISHCTYLLKEPALPKESIIYSKFKVLNELKQITVQGEKISKEMQQKIFHDLFKKNGKVTEEDLNNYLLQSGEFSMHDSLDIKGYSADHQFANNFQSYVDFFGKNGIFLNTTYNLEDAEQIIKWITIFEDKKILERKIRATYPELSEKMPNIINKKYKGWGNLSEKLLTKIYFKNDEGQLKSILDLMEDTDENFMQIYHSKKYDFPAKVSQINNQNKTLKLNYDLVENLATSPANKKGIYQALQIVDEIIKLMGYNPQNIFLEMARGEGKKGRIDPRKKQLEKIFETCKKDILENCDYEKVYNKLKKAEILDTEKIYLYFIQEGKCLYTGEPIDLEHLENYEVDHIIPRSLIKDNSWDNKALVIKKKNQEKADYLVVPKEYRNKNKEWWKHLKKVGLISSKKYYNLCRDNYSEQDIEGFIARQLVETRQICIHVANILENLYKNTKVISLHAHLSSDYRQKFALFKFREINDFHHAQDAYLAAVLGNYQKNYLKKITNTSQLRDMKKYIPNEEERKEKLKYGYVINSLDPIFQLYDEKTGEIVFDIEKFNNTIERTLYQNDIIINRKTEIKTGKLYNDTKNKKTASVGNPIPLKKDLKVEKYGSYSGLQCSYMVLIKYSKKGKLKQELRGMPIMYAERSKKNSLIGIEYFRNLLDLQSNDYLEIKSRPIPFNSLLLWNESYYYITGAGIELQNATELKIEKKYMQKWKYSLNKLLNKKENKKWIEEKYEEELKEIFVYILKKMEKHYMIFEKELKKITELDFLTLSLEEKEVFLKQIFRMLKCNGENANLKPFGLGERMGRINGKKIENGVIITKSITGIKDAYYEF